MLSSTTYVLEFGSGWYVHNGQKDGVAKGMVSNSGLCGIAAASLGLQVVLTDQPELIELLNHNVQLNEQLYPDPKIVRVEEFVWGSDDAKISGGVDPDLILISDCINPIYGPSSWRKLAESCRRFSGASTRILVSYEERGNGEAWKDFASIMSTSHSHFVLDRTKDLVLYELLPLGLC